MIFLTFFSFSRGAKTLKIKSIPSAYNMKLNCMENKNVLHYFCPEYLVTTYIFLSIDKFSTKQESPPVWTQEAYRPPRSCSVSQQGWCPIQSWWGVTPIQSSWGGVPHIVLIGGGYPIQSWCGRGYPSWEGWGYPPPNQELMGVPPPESWTDTHVLKHNLPSFFGCGW